MKPCPCCHQRIHRHAAHCIHCGKRLISGGAQSVYKTIRENSGMGPSEAIVRLAGAYTKSEAAYQLGISRNSLYTLIARFGLEDLEFNRRRKA